MRRARGAWFTPLRMLGMVFVLAGLGCLAFVGWEYLGTNAVARREAAAEISELRQAWQDETRPAEGSMNPSPSEANWLLRIPRFGADYEWPIVAGVEREDLTNAVGWYPSTAHPGQIGNFALAGHRVTHGEPFRRLLELRSGDEVVIETGEAIYTYRITDAPQELTVADTEGWVLDPTPGDPYGEPQEALLTLTTCSDFFRSPDRSVGFGTLQSVDPRASGR